MIHLNCDPDDEIYDDDTLDADEEYPRNSQRIRENIEFFDQFLSYCENYAREEVEDEMGS